MFEIERILTAHDGLHALIGRNVCTRQGTFLAILVIQLEYTAQLRVVARVAETTKGITIPKHTVILIGNNKRNGNFGVVLKQLLIFPLVVEFIRLMLPQAIVGLIIACRLEHLPNGISFGTSVAVFRQNQVSGSIGKTHFAGFL